MADVSHPGSLRRAAMRLVAWASKLSADLEQAWAEVRVPALGLPVRHADALTIGRARTCDCVLSEPTVSRRHAALRREGERWLLRDLGSRNGTRVNGVRVLEETEVRAGDRVSFGDARYRLRRNSGTP